MLSEPSNISGGKYNTWIIISEKHTGRGLEQVAVQHLRRGPIQVKRIVNGNTIRKTEFRRGPTHDDVLNTLRSLGHRVV